MTTDAGSRLYERHDAFLILPYTPHALRAQSGCTLFTLCVSTAWAADRETEQIYAALRAFLHGAVNHSETEERLCRAFYGFFPLAEPLPVRRETAVGRLKAQLETCPERRCSIDDMARTAFLSRYHLIRAFRKEVGLTPHQFQMQNRVRKAQRLLEEDTPAAETALAAGFCDQSHLIRQFGKFVGLTPAEYRRACGAVPPLSAD